MKIAVGSKNPAKIRAALIVVDKLFPEAKIIPIDTPSGVRTQPLSDEEAIKGATKRAKFALKSKDADFGIGMEGGVHKIGKDWFECGWIVVVDKKGKVGIGSSGRYTVPKSWMKEILKGRELKEILPKVTEKKDIHKLEGAMGLITNSHLPRARAYSHGLLFAFAPFISDPKFWE